MPILRLGVIRCDLGGRMLPPVRCYRISGDSACWLIPTGRGSLYHCLSDHNSSSKSYQLLLFTQSSRLSSSYLCLQATKRARSQRRRVMALPPSVLAWAFCFGSGRWVDSTASTISGGQTV